MLLTGNPGPLALHRSGPLMPVAVSGPAGLIRTLAMIDTGSSDTSVALDVLQRIGAKQVGTTQVDTVTVDQSVGLYQVRLTSDAGDLLLNARVLGDQLNSPVQVLIGRDVLAQLRLLYDGPSGSWRLSDDSGGGSGLLLLAVLAGAGVVWFASRQAHKGRR